MKKNIEMRIKKEADYLISTQDTIRNIARIFKISKSTVHKDLQDRLKEYDYQKYLQVEKIFQEHIKVRHIRGGAKTKQKYQLKKEQK